MISVMFRVGSSVSVLTGSVGNAEVKKSDAVHMHVYRYIGIILQIRISKTSSELRRKFQKCRDQTFSGLKLFSKEICVIG